MMHLSDVSDLFSIEHEATEQELDQSKAVLVAYEEKFAQNKKELHRIAEEIELLKKFNNAFLKGENTPDEESFQTWFAINEIKKRMNKGDLSHELVLTLLNEDIEKEATLTKEIEENKYEERIEKVKKHNEAMQLRLREIESEAQHERDDIGKEIEEIKTEIEEYYADEKALSYFENIKHAADYLHQEHFEQISETSVSAAVDNEDATNFFATHPRAWFLLNKKAYLESKFIAIRKQLKDKLPHEAEEKQAESQASGFRAVFVKVFDVAKKIIDAIDDAWTAVKNGLPQSPVTEVLGLGLVGGVGFIIGTAEGYRGIKIAYKAYQNAETRQRKTRILRGASAFALGGAASGMSLTLLIAAAGVSIAAGPLLTVLVPASLAALYAMGLWKNSYVLHETKKEEAQANEDYEGFSRANVDGIQAMKEKVRILELERAELIKKENDRNQSKFPVTKEMREERVIVEAELIKHQNELADVQGTLEGKKRYYEHMQKVRQEKEAKVAFTTIEVAAAVIVVVGATLGVATMIGLGVVSFGTVPLAVTLVGVAIGFGGKIFEKIDEKKGHVYSKAMRGFFVGIGNKIKNVFSPKKELVQQPRVEIENKIENKKEHESTLDMETALHIDPKKAVLDLAARKEQKEQIVSNENSADKPGVVEEKKENKESEEKPSGKSLEL